MRLQQDFEEDFPNLNTLLRNCLEAQVLSSTKREPQTMLNPKVFLEMPPQIVQQWKQHSLSLMFPQLEAGKQTSSRETLKCNSTIPKNGPPAPPAPATEQPVSPSTQPVAPSTAPQRCRQQLHQQLRQHQQVHQ